MLHYTQPSSACAKNDFISNLNYLQSFSWQRCGNDVHATKDNGSITSWNKTNSTRRSGLTSDRTRFPWCSSSHTKIRVGERCCKIPKMDGRIWIVLIQFIVLVKINLIFHLAFSCPWRRRRRALNFPLPILIFIEAKSTWKYFQSNIWHYTLLCNLTKTFWS